MKKFKFTIRGHEYNVHIQEMEDSVATIEVNGTAYEVQLHEEVKKTKTPKLVRQRIQYSAEDSQIPKTAGGAGISIKAPLPGTIFKVIKKAGDVVAAGETVLIMEAMKMENNIPAEKAGTIKEIKVKEGDAVLEGDVLVVIE